MRKCERHGEYKDRHTDRKTTRQNHRDTERQRVNV